MKAFLLAWVGFALLCGAARAEDWRAYHHGIDYVGDGKGGYWVFYSAVDDPKRDVGDEEEWTHGIYVAHWACGEARLTPRLFMHKKGAQEPVSAARAADGHIMITAEDSHGGEEPVNQRYGVYKSDLTPVEAYPEDVEEGGHSGHVAAVGNRFVVVYSDGWVDGGGVDDLGSGYGVYAKIYDSKGDELKELNLAHDKREWWPMAAGSPDRALLLWQAFVKGKTFARLKAALVDPISGRVTVVKLPKVDLAYYTYNAQYMPAIKRFLIVGTREGGTGFAALVDANGQMTAYVPCMPPTVREAGIAVAGRVALTPVLDNKMIRLAATPDSLRVDGMANVPFGWAEEGSVGLPDGADSFFWVALGRYGLLTAHFAPKDFSAPPVYNLCR